MKDIAYYEPIDSVIKSKPAMTSGPIIYRINFDFIKWDKKKFVLDTLIEVQIDKESDFIQLNELVKVKLFHTEVVEYNNLMHFGRFDLFMKSDSGWYKINHLVYSELNKYDGTDHFWNASLPFNAVTTGWLRYAESIR